MDNLQGYTIRRKFKINGTNVTAFFRDEESTPVFSFLDLVCSVYGQDNAGVSLFIKQIPEANKARLINSVGGSQWVVDFEGLSFFLNDKMESHFAKTIISNVEKFLDRESKSLPSPVKVSVRSQVREPMEELNHQFIVQTDDKRPQRYVKIKGLRWFNGADIRSNYCGSSQDYFEDVLLDISSEYRFQTTMPNAGTVTFLNETGLLRLMEITNPDEGKEMFSSLINRCIESEKEVEPETKEEVGRVELSEVYRRKSYLDKSLEIDKNNIFVYETDDWSVSFFEDDAHVIWVKIMNVESSTYLNPKLKEYTGEKREHFKDGDTYLGEFAPVEDCVRQVSDSMEITEEFLHGLTQHIDELSKVEETEQKGEEPMKKYLTTVPIAGTVVAWTDLDMDGKKVFTVFTKKFDDGKIIPLFRATDIGEYAGFSNATTLARSCVDEKFITRTSITEERRNNMRVLCTEGVQKLIEGSGKYNSEDAKSLTQELEKKANEFFESHQDDIKFRLDMMRTKEKIEEENTVEQETTTTEENTPQEVEVSPEVAQQASEAVKNAMSNPEIVQKLSSVPGFGAMAASLLSELTGKNNKVSEDQHAGVVMMNGKPIRAIIVKSPKGGITPYYCVEDFCGAWDLNAEAVKGHMTDDINRSTGNDKNGEVTYVSYADLSNICTFENENARTMVSDTMRNSSDLFNEACKAFGIEFNDDTKRKKQPLKEHVSEQKIDTNSANSMEQLLSHAEDGHAYTVGAIILAERIRNVLAYMKNYGGKIDIDHFPGPTNNNLVKKLWTFIDTQDPRMEAGPMFQQTVVAANERYRCLLDIARSVQKQ